MEAIFEICYLAGFAPTQNAARHEPGQPITRFDETALAQNTE